MEGDLLEARDLEALPVLDCRDVIAGLNWNENLHLKSLPSAIEPLCSAEDIAGVVPVDYRRSYDVHEVAARLVDGSDLLDFKPDYGTATVCLQGNIYGCIGSCLLRLMRHRPD